MSGRDRPFRNGLSLRAYGADRRGSSAAEFALWMATMAIPILSAVDIGYYVYQYMQVRQSAQVAAQSLSTVCGQNGYVPAATSCATNTTTSLSTVMTDAAQSTTLGTNVAVNTAAASTYEGYYCTNTAGALVLASGTSTWPLVSATTITPSTPPSNCAATVASGDGQSPGDYVTVSVTYTFVPMFKGLSIINSIFPASLTRAAWVRVA